MKRYVVQPSVRWQHVDGRTASIYGASPGTEGWSMVQVGYVLRDTVSNVVGNGRPPFALESDAQKYADELNAAHARNLARFTLMGSHGC